MKDKQMLYFPNKIHHEDSDGEIDDDEDPDYITEEQLKLSEFNFHLEVEQKRRHEYGLHEIMCEMQKLYPPDHSGTIPGTMISDAYLEQLARSNWLDFDWAKSRFMINSLLRELGTRKHTKAKAAEELYHPDVKATTYTLIDMEEMYRRSRPDSISSGHTYLAGVTLESIFQNHGIPYMWLGATPNIYVGLNRPMENVLMTLKRYSNLFIPHVPSDHMLSFFVAVNYNGSPAPVRVVLQTWNQFPVLMDREARLRVAAHLPYADAPSLLEKRLAAFESDHQDEMAYMDTLDLIEWYSPDIWPTILTYNLRLRVALYIKIISTEAQRRPGLVEFMQRALGLHVPGLPLMVGFIMK